MIIAFITDSHEVAKILKHIGELTSCAAPDTIRSVPSSCDFDDPNCRHASLLVSRPPRWTFEGGMESYTR